MKIVVFFSGTGTNLESILKEQKNYGYEVVSALQIIPMLKAFKYVKNIKLNARLLIIEILVLEKISTKTYLVF